ncbi:C45 family autoproteolytic acyltransferase/hydolase [Massilibacteroides vaginae]|uniref:C45 family autoproteolytic acyltransferase/hydolase n=1 Tax=Massilibacteroides vaginae TaxID=1673718 RepID=UPI000A1CA8A2|nr:C45 family peptidase [Massilibacteroides vaginae]
MHKKTIIKAIKYTGLCLAGVVLLLFLYLTGLYFSADMKQPDFSDINQNAYSLVKSDSLRTYGPNFLKKSKSGLWEIVLRGSAPERGIAFGKLSEDLLYYQEKVFVDQIKEIIPSESYLKFLRVMLILFNRNMGEYVPLENREEIYGISLSCTHEYDAIGTPYERQLNYHGAHDIGHAMQSYMLVGCSSFGVWGDESADSTLLIGRNFDFYMGDDFARHKLVSFYEPDSGYRFASIGWAGMTGVLSGMNEAGLTVTINAAQSTMPVSAATPISILCRQILQYASTIEEAYQIANAHKTFVSESILIGSAKDGKAAIIEKSPAKTALFETDNNRIICTNHYQSPAFADDKYNQENVATSDSPYRFERLTELLTENKPIDAPKAVNILRNYQGKAGKSIGLANEKSINQFIAHHSVIFKPEERKFWVSTSPWQLGKYVAYDLNDIFNLDPEAELSIETEAIPSDPFLQTQAYQDLLTYKELIKEIRRHIKTEEPLDEKTLLRFQNANPDNFFTWELSGDYYAAFGKMQDALSCWKEALTKEIARVPERQRIEKKIRTKE